MEAFRLAVDLNPNELTPHLYLATAFMVQYIPGAPSAENVEFARAAASEFDLVLRIDPVNLTALQSLASLSYQEAFSIQDTEQKDRKLDESIAWNEKILTFAPRNKEALYAIGAIEWLKSYPEIIRARAQLGLRPDEPGPLRDPALRQALLKKHGALIEDGISRLRKALDIDPAYVDAMSYLNLMIRSRADLADSPEHYRQEIEAADRWIRNALATRENKTVSRDTPVGVLGDVLPAQAPPPPPPPPPRPVSYPAMIGGVGAAQMPPPNGQSAQNTQARIRVAGNVQHFNLIRKVDPAYPPLAKQARIQGTVRFTAIIGRDGGILNLQLVSGHPLLVESARLAVVQWIYKPTLLNGEPVEVVTQIDVTFSLSGAELQ
ncbi:MAG: energy transducer TonB [Acidobacteriota bacterium]|nr:energy transducer TonB [Acidobacteriota bacterium]